MTSQLAEAENYLLLPRRQGEPPKTQRTIPHAQLDCLPSQTTVQALLTKLRKYFTPFALLQQSCISVENAVGLVLCESETTGAERAFMRVPGSREFLHVHPDGSLHVNVPLQAEEEIISKGWGEQHPKYSLGITEIMIYAPRDDVEIDIICQICYESFWYARGDTRMTLHNNPLSGRQFGEDAEQALVAVLKRGKISRYTDWEGEVVNFEQKAANYLGVNFALMVSSGTLALTCALLGVGLEPGDEVLVSAHTWISTAAAVVAIGCIPVIVDIDDSLGMSPLDAKKRVSPLTKAMIVTHMRGIPCNLNALLALAKESNIKFIEDCAQCVGGLYMGRPVGTYGDAGVWSMNHFKNLCCGEGGLVFTNDRNVYERCWSASEPGFQNPTKLNSMRNFPQTREFYSNWNTPHFVFTTGRASELMGALADIQLSQLPHNMNVLQNLRASFIAKLVPPKGYTILQELREAVSCATSLIVLIDTVDEVEDYLLHLRAEQVIVKTLFSKNQVDCSVYYHWTSILNKQSPFRSGFPWCKSNYAGNVTYSPDMCPQTLELLSRAISFEFSTKMTLREAEFMALALNKADYRVHQMHHTV